MSLENLKQNISNEVPELKRDSSGKDLSWYLNHDQQKNELVLGWNYCFRRNDALSAYKENINNINSGNEKLKKIIVKFNDFVKQASLYTLEDAKKHVDFIDSNGDDPYSEYEQEFSSTVRFKIK